MKKFLIIALVLPLLFACSKEENFTPSEKIENGDFSSGMQNWAVKTENGASAKGSVADGSLAVQITNNGSNIWDARLSYTRGLFLKNGVTYRIGFSAWSDVEKQIYPDINGEANGFTHYYQPGVIATRTQSADFFFSFTLYYPDDEKCTVEFDLAEDKTAVHFDNVTIAKLNLPTHDISGDWVFTIYGESGNQLFKYSPNIIMDNNGIIKTNSDMWVKGYVSGTDIEIDYYGYINLKGKVESNKITGTYKNYENSTTGAFTAVPKGEETTDISGTYDLSAFYNTPVVNISNETDVFAIVQTNNSITISSKTGVTGSITGNTVSLSGDILPGSGTGGSQVFSGTISGNSISGTISGTVKVKDINNNISLQTINNGTFTLNKR